MAARPRSAAWLALALAVLASSAGAARASCAPDTTAPYTARCPGDAFVLLDEAASAAACGAAVDYSRGGAGPAFEDACDGEVPGRLDQGLPSNSTFPVGTTRVSWGAADAASNEAAPCAFDVRVASTVRLRGAVDTGNDALGHAVALTHDGSTAVVGAPNDDEYTTNTGSVYVFARRGRDWREEAQLVDPHAKGSDAAGYSVAVSADGGRVFAGAYLGDDAAGDAGRVTVWARAGSGAFFVEARLVAPGAAASDYLGYSVAADASGRLVAAGAPLDEYDGGRTDSGSVYVFERAEEGRVASASWSAAPQRLDAAQAGHAPAVNTERFGEAVALSHDGQVLLVGAPQTTDPVDGANRGSAFVFARNATGLFEPRGRLLAADGRTAHKFGGSVALNGDGSVAAVGAEDHNAAYVYRLDAEGVWRQEARLSPAALASGDKFGHAVSLDAAGGTLTVAARLRHHGSVADAGAVLVFRLDGRGDWTQVTELTRQGQAVASDYVGDAVALAADGSAVLAGAPGAADSAFLFQLRLDQQLSRSSCPEDVLLVLAPPASPAELACEAAAGEAEAAGFVDPGAAAAGAACLGPAAADAALSAGLPSAGAFPLGRTENTYASAAGGGTQCSASVWVAQQLRLPFPAYYSNEDFGYAVAVSDDGEWAVVGAKVNDDYTTDSGSASIYRRHRGAWALQADLAGPDPDGSDYIGHSVAISGDGSRVAIGSMRSDRKGGDSGSVILYDRQGDGDGWRYRGTLVASDGAANSDFGNAVALSRDGQVLLVGARYDDRPGTNAGAAYVFQYNAAGDEWVEAQRLQSDGVATNHHFGWSVAASSNGTRLVIGAAYEDVPATDAGAVYVFVQSGASSWTQEARLTLDGNAASDYFGYRVAVSGDGTRVLASARADDLSGGGSGSATVFARTAAGEWEREAHLLPRTLAASDEIAGVAMSEDATIVALGARYDDDGGSNAGAVFLYRRDGSEYTYAGKTTLSTVASHHLGEALAMSGDGRFLLAGAYGNPEAVFSYQLAPEAALTRASCPADVVVVLPVDTPGECFATAVEFPEPTSCATSSSGGVSRVAGLASGSDFPLGETVNTYRSADDASECSFTVRVVKPNSMDSGSPTSDYNFGYSSAISNDGRYAVNSGYSLDHSSTHKNSGMAWIHTRRADSTWVRQQQLRERSIVQNNYFGHAVDISGDGRYVAIGEHGDDDGGTDTGSVYVWSREGDGLQATWSLQAKLYAPDRAASDYFGVEVALSGDGSRLVVGAHAEDTGAGDTGSVYVFERTGAHWASAATIRNPNPGGSDNFGRYLATSDDGDTIAVGVHIDDDTPDGSVSNGGSVFVFAWNGTHWEQQGRVFAPEARAEDRFGHRVSLDRTGRLLSTGAYQRDEQGSNAGIAYVFRRDGEEWSLATQLTARDGQSGDNFGISTRLSADGTHLAVGAYGDGSGTVTFYRRRSEDADLWEYLFVVGDPIGGTNNGYGLSVSGDGTWFGTAAYNSREAMYVYQVYPETADDAADHACPADALVQLALPAAPADFVCDAEATFLAPAEADCTAAAQNFTLRAGLASGASFPAGVTENVWTSEDDARSCSATVRVVPTLELKTLTRGSNYELGRRVSVSADGRFAAAGQHGDDLATTDAGRVYVFERRLGEWVVDAVLMPQDWAASDYFGIQTALSGDGQRLIVGAHGEDDGGSASGAVYVFERSAAGSWRETTRIKAETPTASSSFGHTVALSSDGTTATVGSHEYSGSRGRVYVFRLNATDGTWREEAALQPANVAGSDIFGYSVAVNADGTRFVAGSRYQDDKATNDGSVYVFSYNATEGVWTEDVELFPSERNAVFGNSEYFGHDVAMSSDGERLVVGGYLTDHHYGNSGSAYVFVRSANGSWAQVAHLAPPSPAESDEFGHAVSMSGAGDLVAVGARYDDDKTSNAGAVYLFRADAGDSGDFHLEGKLLPSETSAVYLGTSARLSENGRVLVAGGTNTERVYAFQLSPDAALGPFSCPADQTVVTEVDEHASCSAEAVFASPSAGFAGASCAPGGVTQTAGLPSGSQFPVGATVNTFRTEADGGSECSQTVRVVKASRIRLESGSHGGNVGYVTAMSGDARYAISGGYHADNQQTNSGVVYLFGRSGSSRWTQLASFYETSPSGSDYLGHAVTMSEDGRYAAAGAYGDHDRGTDTGSVYVYVRSGEGASATFGVQAKLYAPEGDIVASDLFGISVRLSGDGSVLMVGASHEDTGASAAGTIFMYKRNGTEWSFTHKVVNPEPAGSDHFGYLKGNSLSDDGLALAVGVLHDDAKASNAGSVFMYSFDAAAADGAGEWTPEGRLNVPVQRADDHFGRSTALGGDASARVLAVGANSADFSGSASGVVYMFARNATDGTWSLSSMVHPREWRSGMQFGIAVELSADGTTLAVGAHADTSSRGSIHVFRRGAADWATWTEVSRLHAPDATTTWNLGHEVDVSSDGKWVLGGAYSQNTMYAFQLEPEAAGEALAEWTCPEDALVVLAPPATPSAAVCAPAAGEVTFASPLERACTAANATELDVTQTDGLPSGAAFPVGRTTNRWVAGSDGRECSADVVVVPTLVMKTRRPTTDLAFGRTVTVSADGRVAAVGAHADDATTTDTGRVHMFERRLGEWVAVQELIPTDYAASDYFGIDVSLSEDGNRLLVGAYGEDDGASNSGAAYVFERVLGVWTETARLKAAAPLATSYFGYSVSLSGDGNTAVIGAYAYSSSRGMTYVFRRNDADNTWLEEAAIQPANAANNDLFGYDVAVDRTGSRFVASSRDAHRAAADEGAAYVYSFNATLDAWEEEAELGLPLSSPYLYADQEFGQSVSISGDGEHIVIGARYVDLQAPNAGAAYAFTRAADGNWSLDAHLAMPEDGYNGARFGCSVALNGDGSLVVVGAQLADKYATDAGAAYVFRRDGTSWFHVGRLGGSEASTNLGKGVAVSASGNMALAGGHGSPEQVRSYQLAPDAALTRASCPADVTVTIPANEPGECAAAAVEFPEPTSCATSSSAGVSRVAGLASGSDFPLGETVNTYRSADNSSECSFTVRVVKSLVNQGYRPTTDDVYASGLAMSDDGLYMIAGSYATDASATNTGSFYIYARKGTSEWVRQVHHHMYSPGTSDHLGWGVGMSGDGKYAASGAYLDDDKGTNTGSLTVFVRTGDGLHATWAISAKLYAPDPHTSDYFGLTCDFSHDGSRLAVGAYGHDAPGSDVGVIYVFERDGGEWSAGVRVDPEGLSTTSHFAHAIGMSANGDYVVGGAHGHDDPGASNAGALAVAHHNGTHWEHQAVLKNPRPETDTYLGHRYIGISAGGEFIAAGARDANLHGVDTGAAYVFARNGAEWSLATELLAPAYIPGMRFGEVDMSADGTHVVVGAYADSDGGSALVFRRLEDDWSRWEVTVRLDRNSMTGTTQVGHSPRVSGDGTWVALGAPGSNEAAFSFQLYPDTAHASAEWACPADVLRVLPVPATPSDVACGLEAGEVTYLGPAEIDCSAGAAGVAQTGGLASGNAFPLGSTVNTWAAPDGSLECSSRVRVAQALRLLPLRDTNDADFGRTVVISADGRFSAVGAHADDDSGSNSGSVTVFRRANGEWVAEATFNSPYPGANYYFGHAVTISGDGHRVVVGAHGLDKPSLGDVGAAFVYERVSASGRWEYVAELGPSDALANTQFGYSTSLSGDGLTAVIGARRYQVPGDYAGRVYVFRRNAETGAWDEEAALQPAGVKAADYFGYDVACSRDGSRFVASSLHENVQSSDDGAAYVFDRSEGGAWTQAARVLPGERNAHFGSGDTFGLQVAISGDGDDVAVGAYVNDHVTTNTGSAYLYHRGDDGAWRQTAHLTPMTPDASDEFGVSVALSGSGDLVAIGARYDDDLRTDGGAVYLYERTAEAEFHLAGKMVPPEAVTWNSGYFGRDVALSDDGHFVLVGANGNSERVYSIQLEPDDAFSAAVCPPDRVAVLPVDAASCAASVDFASPVVAADNSTCVPTAGAVAQVGGVEAGGSFGVGVTLNTFRATATGLECTQRVRVIKTLRATREIDTAADEFGVSVALTRDGSRMAVGARYDDDVTTNTGEVTVFRRSRDRWVQEATFTSSEVAASDHFGQSVAVDDAGAYLVVGAPYDDAPSTDSGAAYGFVRQGDQWTQQAVLAPDTVEASALFGYSVALDGTGYVALVGAYLRDVHFGDAGAAYVFARTGQTWVQRQELAPDAGDTAGSAWFGWSVALSGDARHAVVGAAHAKPVGGSTTDTGAAYVFSAAAAGGDLVLRQRLEARHPTANEEFGYSVDVSDDGTRLVVGAVHDSDLGTTSGAAYVFAREGAHDAPGAWSLETALYGADQIAADEAGYSVGMSADGLRVAVGSPHHEHAGASANGGAVRVFDREGAEWHETATLTASDGGASHFLGRAVAVSASGATVAGGAPGGNRAYSWQMEEEQELRAASCPASRVVMVPATDAASCEAPVPLDAGFPGAGDQCVAPSVNASQTAGPAAGQPLHVGLSVLRFESEDGTSSCETEVRVIRALEVGPKGDTGSDEYGRVVRISRDGQVAAVGTMYDDDVGTNTGSVSMMLRNGSEWVQHQQLYAQPAVSNTYFAHRMDMSADGQMVVVGSLYFDDQGTNTGKVFIYRWSDETSLWEFEASLLPRVPATSGHFGGAVTTDERGDHLAVGEYNHGEGKVHFYVRAGGVWTWQATHGPAQAGVSTQSFGHTIDMDLAGTTVVVGAHGTDTSISNRGAAFVFSRTGSDWQQQARLFAPDSASGDYFGLGVDVSGDARWLAISSYQDNDRGANSGSVYLYERGGDSAWLFRRKVFASSASASDEFGYTVALDDTGSRLVVTSRYDDEDGGNRGAAYVFERSGADWRQLAKLRPSDTDAGIGGTEFGWDVHVSGDGVTALVGGRLSSSSTGGHTGRVWSFDLDPHKPVVAAAGPVRSVRDCHHVAQAGFVDADECTAPVLYSTPQFSAGPCAAPGSLVIERTSGFAPGAAFPVGTTAVTHVATDSLGHSSEHTCEVTVLKTAKLDAAGASPAHGHGASVATSRDGMFAAVGTPGNESVSVFVRDDTSWVLHARLEAPAGDAHGEGGAFGSAVAVSDNGAYLVVGAPLDSERAHAVNLGAASGAAHVFRLVGTEWVHAAKLTAADGVADDRLGTAVAVSADGAFVVAGAPGFDEAVVSNGGAAFVFQREGAPGTPWVEQARLHAPDAKASDAFGGALSLGHAGALLAVGVPQSDPDGAASGAAYIFVRRDPASSAWAFEIKLRPDSPYRGTGNQFATSVAVSGDGRFVAAGSHLGNAGAGTRSGFVTVFERRTWSATRWQTHAVLVPEGSQKYDEFGSAVHLSGDGSRLAVGAAADDRGDIDAGSVHVFARDDDVWYERVRAEAPDGRAGDAFGSAVALTSDGLTLVAAAPLRDGGAGAAYAVALAPRPLTVSFCPAEDVTADVTSGGGCTAVVETPSPSYFHDCPAAGVTVTQTSGLASGSAFPLGTTRQVFVLRDPVAGVEATCEYNVVVSGSSDALDVVCPANVTLQLERAGRCTQRVEYAAPEVVAGCSVAQEPSLARGLPSGSFFPVGTTVTEYEARDARGNTASCAFAVTLEAPCAGGTYDADECVCACEAPKTLAEGGQACECGAGTRDDGAGGCEDVDACAAAPCPAGYACEDLPAPSEDFACVIEGGGLAERLTVPGGEAGDLAGAAVAVSDDGARLVVGAPGAGRVRVYTRDVQVDGAPWLLAKVLAPAGAAGDEADAAAAEFGYSVAVDRAGLRVLVGAPGDSREGAASGRAYVFDRIEAGVWSQATILAPGGNRPGERFGANVALSEDSSRAAVGAPGADGGAGAVTVYEVSAASVYRHRTEVTALAGRRLGEGVGAAVALSEHGSVAVVGGRGERAFAFAEPDVCDGRPCFPSVECGAAVPPASGYTCGSCPEGMEGDGESCEPLEGYTCEVNPLLDRASCRLHATSGAVNFGSDAAQRPLVRLGRSPSVPTPTTFDLPRNLLPRSTDTLTVEVIDVETADDPPGPALGGLFSTGSQVMRVVTSTGEQPQFDVAGPMRVVTELEPETCTPYSYLGLYDTDAGAWSPAADTCLGSGQYLSEFDADACTLTTNVCHLTDFAVLTCDGEHLPTVLLDEGASTIAGDRLRLVLYSAPEEAFAAPVHFAFVDASQPDGVSCHEQAATGTASDTWSHEAFGDCADRHMSALPLADTLSGCGWAGPHELPGLAGAVLFNATLLATTTRVVGEVQGTPVTRTERTSFDVQVLFPTDVNVQSAGPATVSGPALSEAALSRLEYDVQTRGATASLVTSVQWPYELFDAAVEGIDGTEDDFDSAVQLAVRAAACDDTGSVCAQTWAVTATPKLACPEGGRLDGRYRVTYRVGCSPLFVGACQEPEVSTATVEFAVASDDTCPRVVEVAAVQGSLTMHTSAARRDARQADVDFVFGTDVYARFDASPEGGLAIASTRLDQVSVTSGDGVEVLLYFGAGVTDPHNSGLFYTSEHGSLPAPGDEQAGSSHYFQMRLNDYTTAFPGGLATGVTSAVLAAELTVTFEAAEDQAAGGGLERRVRVLVDVPTLPAAAGAQSGFVVSVPGGDDEGSEQGSGGLQAGLSGLAAVAAGACVVALLAFVAVVKTRRQRQAAAVSREHRKMVAEMTRVGSKTDGLELAEDGAGGSAAVSLGDAGVAGVGADTIARLAEAYEVLDVEELDENDVEVVNAGDDDEEGYLEYEVAEPQPGTTGDNDFYGYAEGDMPGSTAF